MAYSGIDAIGDRLTSGTSSAFGYLLADLHGNVVAVMTAGSNPSYSSAYRYDAYGETCDSYSSGSGAITSPWRFGGRILESASGSTDLYDFVARSYDPSLGAFTSFDSVAGSAQNPLTLNRYLYADANPATLVDPDGHCSWNPFDGDSCESQPITGIWETGQNVVGFAGGFASETPGAVLGFGQQTFNGMAWLGGKGVGGLQCAADTSCGVHNVQDAWDTFSGDPGGSVQSAFAQAVDATKSDLSRLAFAGADLAKKYERCEARNDYFSCGQESSQVFVSIEGNGLLIIYGGKGILNLARGGAAMSAAEAGEAALADARDSASALRASGITGTTAAGSAVSMETGVIYRGVSGALSKIPELLRGIVPETSLEPWATWNCAEVAACAAALQAGEKLENLVTKAVRIKNGVEMPPCDNCVRWLPGGMGRQ